MAVRPLCPLPRGHAHRGVGQLDSDRKMEPGPADAGRAPSGEHPWQERKETRQHPEQHLVQLTDSLSSETGRPLHIHPTRHAGPADRRQKETESMRMGKAVLTSSCV